MKNGLDPSMRSYRSVLTLARTTLTDTWSILTDASTEREALASPTVVEANKAIRINEVRHQASGLLGLKPFPLPGPMAVLKKLSHAHSEMLI